MTKTITLPISDEAIKSLKCGDTVLLTGDMITGRDAAHKRIVAAIGKGQAEVSIKGETIYYVGPCPAKNGDVIGSAGPTTSMRMDSYAPTLMDNGLKAMIGKGFRNDEVKQAIVRNGCVYFAAIGGAGALYSRCITASAVIAYEDLGTEAVRRITVKDFPVIVAIDSYGNDIYEKRS